MNEQFVTDTGGIKEMTEVAKLLYIVVEEDEETKGNEESSFRYTRPVLQSTLQLMGCKARHAFKVSNSISHHPLNLFVAWFLLKLNHSS